MDRGDHLGCGLQSGVNEESRIETKLDAGMVPLPQNSVFGDLTSEAGIPGQNSPTPSEKFFTQHFIVKAPSGLSVGGPYFDPSYGATYSDNCAFESQAVAGYAVKASTTAPTWNFGVRQPTGSCNITFNIFSTN
jgi:hypothetical protein